MRDKRPVLQLNASYEVLGWIDFNDAVTKLVTTTVVNGKTKPKAYIFESLPDKFVQGPPVLGHAHRLQIPWPVCVILERYVHVDVNDGSLLTDDTLAARTAILRRDGFRCMYCGKPGSTWDHILPQSRGGLNTWWNLTTACVACNSRKANRTPEEAGMPLLRQPYEPAQDKYAREQKRVYRLLDAV